MDRLYSIEHLRLCWDYFQDGHFGLDGNPESFDEWLDQAGLHPAKMMADKSRSSEVAKLNLPPIRKKMD